MTRTRNPTAATGRHLAWSTPVRTRVRGDTDGSSRTAELTWLGPESRLLRLVRADPAPAPSRTGCRLPQVGASWTRIQQPVRTCFRPPELERPGPGANSRFGPVSPATAG